MFGGLMKSTSRLALIAVAGFAVGGFASAQAADLGGDCCADLEERVAELEATTVRKGNRKVSLTLYGQITSGVMWWDASRPASTDVTRVNESNVYVVDPQTSSTRFGMRGSAKITSDWEAGFNLELEIQTVDAQRVRVNNDEGPDLGNDNDALFRQAHWYLKSATLGRFAVGRQDMATSSISEIDLSASYIADGMSSSAAGAGIIQSDLFGAIPGAANFSLSNYELNRRDAVRYDTPTFAGFVATVSWGEDDFWDIALRYAGEWNSIKVAAGIGYSEETDSTTFQERTAVQGGLSIMHVPSGLFFTGSAGDRDTDNINGTSVDEEFWHFTAGIEQKWIALGKTTIFGMGGRYKQDQSTTPLVNDGFVDREAEYWGGGIVQQIDAAAMELYISYRHYELDSRADTNPATFDAEFDAVLGGGRIKF